MNESLEQIIRRKIQYLPPEHQEEVLSFIEFLEEGHCLIEGHLCEIINRFYQRQKIAQAFLKLPCYFGGKTIIPDISVFRCDRIPVISSGENYQELTIYPDWSIEILSLQQNPTKILGNLLYCSEYGTELGWLIDPVEATVLVVLPEQRVQLLQGEAKLPVLPGIDLDLTIDQVLDWSIIEY
ncbi:Uma2 family endonuclease [Planktothrix sp. FACHB-1365]|uniref:Uma2 family endonuclease n=1 Tax=Planktothrix sp. FACHB-1365 TaxID=2692855 RepID=UPI001686AC1D|nr:Uma2 family endonuclease [Planktothrix sp. FACHB-1365]MBD2484505.1 Uma2 family endonuclease [Planktothrix sp. FACHB-1365]